VAAVAESACGAASVGLIAEAAGRGGEAAEATGVLEEEYGQWA